MLIIRQKYDKITLVIKMKIALGQMNVIAGQPSKNVENMLSMIQEAKQAKAELIVFPEMCVSGYMLGDKWMDHAFCETLIEYNEVIKEASEGIGIIWGNIGNFENIKGRDGRKCRCNCAYFAYDKKWVEKENGKYPGLYVKYLNPDYRMFDDSRYFYSALELSRKLKEDENFLTSCFIFEKDGKKMRIGLEVCEDLWSGDYNFDPTQHYLNQKAELIVNISCSPWTLHKEIGRERQILRHAKIHHDFVPMVYVNAVGMQNSGKSVCVFDGDSTIYDSKGERMISCNDSFMQECKIVELNESSLSQQCEYKLLYALLCAIRQFDIQIFSSRFKWMVGLSGGLDSSVNAALLTMALGKERVIGLNMATKYNSSTTIDNAHHLANVLGFECRDGIIQSLVEAQLECLKQYTNQEISEFAIENIQARIRGSILSGISQVENAVVINNGNKVEAAFGYATLYGDTIGCLAPLQDVTKVELFELAHQINEVNGKEVIPYNLLPIVKEDGIDWIMPPSAELKNNQVDPMKWFYHDELVKMMSEYPAYGIEKLMQDYLSGEVYHQAIGKWIKYYHLDDPKAFIEDLEWVLNKFELGVFKRIQSAPIVTISRGAFGNDFRENQCHYERSRQYLELKEAILHHAHQ